MKPTSRMPKDLKEKWLAALRSGEYKQSQQELGTPERGFCCLGLLQYIVDGKTESDGIRDELPSSKWCGEHGCDWDLIDYQNGNLSLDEGCASELNDNGYTFAEIANLIEQHVEGV